MVAKISPGVSESRNLSHNNELSAHCLRVSAAKINKEMETLLVKGYRAAAKESRALTKEFENTDLEGRDD